MFLMRQQATIHYWALKSRSNFDKHGNFRPQSESLPRPRPLSQNDLVRIHFQYHETCSSLRVIDPDVMCKQLVF